VQVEGKDTPLHLAAGRGLAKAVELLVKAGAKVDGRDKVCAVSACGCALFLRVAVRCFCVWLCAVPCVRAWLPARAVRLCGAVWLPCCALCHAPCSALLCCAMPPCKPGGSVPGTGARSSTPVCFRALRDEWFEHPACPCLFD
jgi:hypothetical protein